MLTKLDTEVPKALRAAVNTSTRVPSGRCERRCAGDLRSVWRDDGLVVQSLLREGQVDDLIVTAVPALGGSGRPPHGSPPGDLPLEHVESRTFRCGCVRNRWRGRHARTH